MTAITIELQDDNDVDLFLKLAKRINARIINLNSKANNNKSPMDFIDKIAKSGGVNTISDPSIWQSEIRQDSPLFGRDTIC